MQITVNNTTPIILSSNINKSEKNINFEMAPGNYLYNDALSQKKVLINNLTSTLEKGKDFAKGIENSIRQTFPLINFAIGNISDLGYANIKKEQPLVFSRTSFKNETPKTFFYFNFPEIIEIVKSKSYRRLEGLSESIASNVVLANEPHYVSKIVDMCTQQIKSLSILNLENIKNIINKCINTYNLNINNTVLDKNSADKIDTSIQEIKTSVTDVKYLDDDVVTKLCIIMDDSDYKIRQAISHEFVHTLNANSVWINQIHKELLDIPEAPIAQLDFAPTFISLYQKNPEFLKLPYNKRGEEYESILKNVMDKVSNKRDKELVLQQALTLASDEAHAYSQTPELFKEYRNSNISKNVEGIVSVPIGWFYEDFYDFLLSVTNNNNLLDSITS